jgi:hypothetical protein
MMTMSTDGLRVRTRTDLAIGVIATLNAIAALVGALGLMWGFLSLDATATSRLPWQSSVLGGIALGLVVGLPNAVVAWLAFNREPDAGRAAVAAGFLLIGWIVVELAFIRELSFFHPLYVAIGLVMIWLGRRADRR